jgi:hypothetical protein
METITTAVKNLYHSEVRARARVGRPRALRKFLSVFSSSSDPFSFPMCSSSPCALSPSPSSSSRRGSPTRSTRSVRAGEGGGSSPTSAVHLLARQISNVPISFPLPAPQRAPRPPPPLLHPLLRPLVRRLHPRLVRERARAQPTRNRPRDPPSPVPPPPHPPTPRRQGPHCLPGPGGARRVPCPCPQRPQQDPDPQRQEVELIIPECSRRLGTKMAWVFSALSLSLSLLGPNHPDQHQTQISSFSSSLVVTSRGWGGTALHRPAGTCMPAGRRMRRLPFSPKFSVTFTCGSGSRAARVGGPRPLQSGGGWQRGPRRR